MPDFSAMASIDPERSKFVRAFGIPQEMVPKEFVLLSQIDPTDTSWVSGQACMSEEDLFSPARGGNETEAKELCNACSSQARCLAWAIINGENREIWGGMNSEERGLFRVDMASCLAIAVQAEKVRIQRTA